MVDHFLEKDGWKVIAGGTKEDGTSFVLFSRKGSHTTILIDRLDAASIREASRNLLEAAVLLEEGLIDAHTDEVPSDEHAGFEL